MADPLRFPTSAEMCVELYLERQDPNAGALELSCLFCHRQNDVLWETSYSMQTGTSVGVGVCEHCRVHFKPRKPKAADGALHVDDFIGSHFQDPYARFMLDYFRSSAVNQQDFRPFMEGRRLFCTYHVAGGSSSGHRMRVTGASRLGDIWLAEDLNREVGYDMRVNVLHCSDWGAEP